MFRGSMQPDATGGVLFRIRSIHWVSATEVLVHGGFYVGPLGAAGNRYTVEKRAGAWVVTSRELEWIS